MKGGGGCLDCEIFQKFVKKKKFEEIEEKLLLSSESSCFQFLHVKYLKFFTENDVTLVQKRIFKITNQK